MCLPSLMDALADVPEFRPAQGRRYDLLSVLLLCCVVGMCGARSRLAIADWGANRKAGVRVAQSMLRSQGATTGSDELSESSYCLRNNPSDQSARRQRV